jgi:hypothetical protein
MVHYITIRIYFSLNLIFIIKKDQLTCALFLNVAAFFGASSGFGGDFIEAASAREGAPLLI